MTLMRQGRSGSALQDQLIAEALSRREILWPKTTIKFAPRRARRVKPKRLEEKFGQHPPEMGMIGCLTIAHIQHVVAWSSGWSRKAILGNCRLANLVRARHTAMYLSKLLTKNSLSEIGRRFGGRDHTTVLHAVRRITEACASDETLTVDIAELRERLER